jgi:TM2 domain-containing membrane protein YozV
MNCLNHPEVPAAAYCQNCGKALCTDCMRSVGGVVYCEPCLSARLSGAGVAGAPMPGLHANPLLAGLLGFIPGVGAMYNGQYVKALAHVLIFAVFVSLSDRSFVFGLLIAAWVFYQVFDAAQTAKARRDGLPLPNPFGLNDLGTRLGMTGTTPFVAGVGSVPPPPPGPAGQGFGAQGFGAQGFGTGTAPPPPPGYTAPPPYTPVNVPPVYPTDRHKTPVGAIVLIAVGLVLLLQTLGIFEQEWINKAWPLIIIGIGGWLLYRRTHETPRGGGL